MQGPEEKKRPGKHAAPPEQEAQDDVLRADADLYGDEADIPIRPRKKAQSGGKPGAKKGRNPAAKGKKGKKKKRASLAARLAALNVKPGFRKRRKMFEVVRSDDDARVGTILVFGRRLSLKLLIALSAAVVAVALVLPGISVSFMLLVMGMYDRVLQSVASLDLLSLVPLGLGLLAGILATTRTLERAMARFPRPTYLIILGFVLGSVLEVFPGLPGSILEWLICLVLAGGGFSAVHLLSRREETLSGD